MIRGTLAGFMCVMALALSTLLMLVCIAWADGIGSLHGWDVIRSLLGIVGLAMLSVSCVMWTAEEARGRCQ